MRIVFSLSLNLRHNLNSRINTQGKVLNSKIEIEFDSVNQVSIRLTHFNKFSEFTDRSAHVGSFLEFIQRNLNFPTLSCRAKVQRFFFHNNCKYHNFTSDRDFRLYQETTSGELRREESNLRVVVYEAQKGKKKNNKSKEKMIVKSVVCTRRLTIRVRVFRRSRYYLCKRERVRHRHI